MLPRAMSRAIANLPRGFAKAWSRDLRSARRALLRVDREVAQRYFASHTVRKLHLGCGRNILDGWLNSDFFPKSSAVLHLDARGRFPFEADQFDYVYSEHMIEHLAYAKGASMICESFRVLKPGGTLRISTPDLAFLVDLRRDNRSQVQNDYIAWATGKFSKDAPYADDTFVINNFVRRWGHLFIYDEKTLGAAFTGAGFRNVIRRHLNESDHGALRDLENERRMPDGFLRLETMTLEGTKPGP